LTPLPAVVTGSTLARSIAIHPSGRWLRVSSDSGTALFSVDTATGVVANAGAVAASRLPRRALFDPSGTLIYVANEDDDNVSILRFGAARGAAAAAGLQNTPDRPFALTVSAFGAAVQPGPRLAYSTHGNDGLLRTWRAGASGALAPVGTPLVAEQGTRPTDPQVHPSGRFLYAAEQFGAASQQQPRRHVGARLQDRCAKRRADARERVRRGPRRVFDGARPLRAFCLRFEPDRRRTSRSIRRAATCTWRAPRSHRSRGACIASTPTAGR
jgi:hypothetical protein